MGPVGGQPTVSLRLVPRENSTGLMLIFSFLDVLFCFQWLWQMEVKRVPFWHALSDGALSSLTFTKTED